MPTDPHPGELGVPAPAPRPSLNTLFYCWLGAVVVAAAVGTVLAFNGQAIAGELIIAGVALAGMLALLMVVKRRQKQFGPPPAAPDTTTLH